VGLGIAIAVDGKIDPQLGLATRVEVYERMGETTTYSIYYEMQECEGDFISLIDGRIGPGAELSVLVPQGDKTECLVKGPVHGQQIHLEHGGAGSRVDVKGSDSCIIMDRDTKAAAWPDVTDSDAVSSIIAQYNYAPDVQTTTPGHFENKHSLIQRESDLRFIKRLARRNGFLFWITCDAEGNETAHFKRPPADGPTVAKLLINQEPPNIQALDISWDVERPTSIEGRQLDLNSKETFEVGVNQTPQTILGRLGLSALTGDTRSVHLSAPVDDAGDIRARGEGAVIEADWFTQASCRTSLEFLGTLVRASTILEIQGAGSRHSGKYYVAAVRHTIDTTSHLMNIELVRNGWSA
jgi:phage protein D